MTQQQDFCCAVATDPEMPDADKRHWLHQAAHQFRDSLASRAVPVQRSEGELLVSIAQLLEEQLAELRHIRAALAADDRKDSFAIDSNSSAGKIKVSAKRYAATVDEARADAELEFARGMALLEQAQTDGWQATVQRLAAERTS